jgi:leader peptidase (prepilin peptidase)/N-methyltransferase
LLRGAGSCRPKNSRTAVTRRCRATSYNLYVNSTSQSRERALHTDFITPGLNVFLIAAFFIFGLVFGSFLNVCIYRMPRELSVVKPRSACPRCEKPIAAYDNIPVLSWILLGGKCRQCKAPISPRYAAVELLTGGLFVIGYLAASGSLPGFVVSTCDLAGRSVAEPIKFCVFSFLLIGLIFTDAETKLLPDLLTKPGIALGLALSLFVPVECGEPCGAILLPSLANVLANIFPVPGPIYSLVNALAGAIMGSAFILGIALLYEAVRGVEGMGRGDVKLMAMIGAFVGVKLTLLVLVLASLIGSTFGLLLILVVWRKRLARRRRRHPSEPAGESRSRAWQSAILIYRNFEIPFGVFLGIAALFAAFWGTWLVCWYLRFSKLA